MRWGSSDTVSAAFRTRIASVHRETPHAALLRVDLAHHRLTFHPGQSVSIGLSDQPVRKRYSIACSPRQAEHTGLLELLVKTDVRGRADVHLADVAKGAEVEIDGPFGRLLLPDPLADPHLLFVSGGLGIAPLRSIMWTALELAPAPDIGVVYSARSAKEFAFAAELRRLHGQGQIQLRLAITREVPDNWESHRGRINQAMLAAAVGGHSPRCFVCGPDSFVGDVRSMLRDCGIPNHRIWQDEH